MAYYLWGFDSPMIDHGKVNSHATIACWVFPHIYHVRSHYSGPHYLKFPRRLHHYYHVWLLVCSGRDDWLRLSFDRHVKRDWWEIVLCAALMYFFISMLLSLYFSSHHAFNTKTMTGRKKIIYKSTMTIIHVGYGAENRLAAVEMTLAWRRWGGASRDWWVISFFSTSKMILSNRAYFAPTLY